LEKDGRWENIDRDNITSMIGTLQVSICVTAIDVKEILNNIGFEILEEEIGVECYYSYTTDQRSMMSDE